MIAGFVTTILGVILVVYGVIAAISPLPLGIPLVIVGLMMIAAANPAARPLIRRMRTRWRWFDVLVRKAAKASPDRFKKTFAETAPDGGEQTEKSEEEKPV